MKDARLATDPPRSAALSKSFGRAAKGTVTIVALALVMGAFLYYLGAAAPSASTVANGTTTPTVNLGSTSSSSISSAGQNSSGQGARLEIRASVISHLLGTTQFSATCGPSAPAEGASYIEVTNAGAAPATISSVSFSFIDMTPVTESGVPAGACTLGAGATGYVTFAGIGQDRAYAGVSFTVTVNWGGGGFAYADGSFS